MRLTKPLTLLFFFSMITGFVIYRSGALDDNLQGSPNGGTVNTNGNDSIKKYNERIMMMSSSKSMIILPDSVRKSISDSFPKDSSSQNLKIDMEMFGGSKSGIIFHPEPKDTAKKAPKK